MPPTPSVPSNPSSPNYTELIRFLVSPFLESPDSLSVDCEPYGGAHKFWIRVAFSGADKGRVFGRGGRTIQAIRTVVEAAAKNANQSVNLEVFGEQESSSTTERRPPNRKRAAPKRH